MIRQSRGAIMVLALIAALAGPARAEEESQPDPTKPEEREPVVYCPVCDTVPDESDLFCARDGTELETLLPPEVPECPVCSRKGETGDLHCRVDGEKLRVPALRPDEKKQYFELYFGRGLGAERGDRHERAAAFFEAAVRFAEPDRAASTRARSFRALGRLDLEAGRMKPAVLDLLLSATLDPRAAETFVALGDLYTKGGRIRDAIQNYDHALGLDAGLARAYTGRAGARALRGDQAGALTDLGEAIRLDPLDADPLLRRAVIHFGSARYDSAEADAGEAIRLGPTDASAWILRGTIRTRKGDLPRALADLDRAIEIEPRRAEAHYRRGLALLGLKRGEAAQTALAVAVGLSPDYSGAVMDVVRTLKPTVTDPRIIRSRSAVDAAREAMTKGKATDAIKQYLTALQFAPGDPDILKALGDAYRRAGRVDEAVSAYTRALTAAPRSVGALFARGFAHHEAGRLDAASEDYAAALALEPGNALALNALGNVHFAQGRHAEAERAYSRAIDRDPGFARAYHNRGLARAALGRKEDALVDHESSLLLDPSSVSALKRIGLLSLEARNTARARRALRLATELSPSDVDARYNLALALEHDTRGLRYGEGYPIEEAISAYRRVLRIDSRRTDASENLGILLLKAGRPGEARGILHRAAAQDPGNVTVLYHLALALEYADDGERAGSGARLQESIQYYGRALGKDEAHVPSLLNRALLLVRVGQDEEALEDLARLRDLIPDDPDVEYNRALALSRLGRKDEAAAALGSFESKGGDPRAARTLRESWD